MPMPPNPDLIEKRFLDSLLRYIVCGIEPGQFIRAVIENNLMEAIGRGDHDSIANLPHIVSWLYNRAPNGCWQNPTFVKSWLIMDAAQRKRLALGSILQDNVPKSVIEEACGPL